jgi:hypothetical protein
MSAGARRLSSYVFAILAVIVLARRFASRRGDRSACRVAAIEPRWEADVTVYPPGTIPLDPLQTGLAPNLLRVTVPPATGRRLYAFHTIEDVVLILNVRCPTCQSDWTGLVSPVQSLEEFALRCYGCGHRWTQRPTRDRRRRRRPRRPNGTADDGRQPGRIQILPTEDQLRTEIRGLTAKIGEIRRELRAQTVDSAADRALHPPSRRRPKPR